MTRLDDILRGLDKRRRSLQMPLAVLCERSGVSVSTANRALSGCGAVSFATVARIADALGVELSCVRSRSIAEMRHHEAAVAAKRMVSMVQGTSALEGQAVDPEQLALMEQRTEAELLSAGPGLWAR